MREVPDVDRKQLLYYNSLGTNFFADGKVFGGREKDDEDRRS